MKCCAPNSVLVQPAGRDEKCCGKRGSYALPGCEAGVAQGHGAAFREITEAWLHMETGVRAYGAMRAAQLCSERCEQAYLRRVTTGAHHQVPGAADRKRDGGGQQRLQQHRDSVSEVMRA